MALLVTTSSPTDLLAAMQVAIKIGRLPGWELVQDVYITHTAPPLTYLAFFRPVVQHGVLLFQIVPPQGRSVDSATYAAYHGKLTEMLLQHFDHMFSQATASAQRASADVAKSAPQS